MLANRKHKVMTMYARLLDIRNTYGNRQWKVFTYMSVIEVLEMFEKEFPFVNKEKKDGS